ncbi:hypothetical protein UFOVP225_79 [uncultured Caudovirales phage]|uniref:Uncharacterized protein n=1 Tax=uncultured Caudovirales phage TaxID=2100421 RepID=A0A6J7WTT3_9CAUD|nr:hypothetical protein UFOVP225_79 [uncultured Caudovirales phage]
MSRFVFRAVKCIELEAGEVEADDLNQACSILNERFASQPNNADKWVSLDVVEIETEQDS